MPETDDKARAFNSGSEARLNGVDRTANPHTGVLRALWAEGWRDVDKYFGVWSTRRAVYLRPVQADNLCGL